MNIKEAIELFISFTGIIGSILGPILIAAYFCGKNINRIENVEKQMEKLNNLSERVSILESRYVKK